jgi:hypothetical protein
MCPEQRNSDSILLLCVGGDVSYYHRYETLYAGAAQRCTKMADSPMTPPYPSGQHRAVLHRASPKQG